MLAEVKKYVENHDIKGLRYIFVDCLDVDPTFEKYKTDYEYCKSVDGMFDSHQELTGLTADESRWTMQYWERLKLDLMKNFSEKRFEHMVKVAKVVYADKVARLLNERKEKAVSPKQEPAPTVSQTEHHMPTEPVSVEKAPKPKFVSEAELQEKRIAERKRELETEYQRVEAEEEAKKAKREAARREALDKQNNANSSNDRNGDDSSKKVMGIVLAIVAIVVIVLIILVLHGHNPL